MNDAIARLLEQARGVSISRKAAYEVIRADGGESGGEDFLEDELLIAAALSAALAKASETALPGLQAALSGRVSLDGFANAVEQANIVMSQAFDNGDGTASTVRNHIRRVIRRGAQAGTGSAAILDELPRFQDILNGMVNSAKYYTNSYFNTHVMPALFQQVEAILTSNEAVTDLSWTAIREAMGARLVSVPYWRTVANAAASRGYHYGVVKGGQQAGYRGYQLVAVIDQKTSAICVHLNGRVFWLADAVAHMERIAEADPDEVKSIAPWYRLAEIEGADNQTLKEMGVLVPPFHGNCRTTLMLIRS